MAINRPHFVLLCDSLWSGLNSNARVAQSIHGPRFLSPIVCDHRTKSLLKEKKGDVTQLLTFMWNLFHKAVESM